MPKSADQNLSAFCVQYRMPIQSPSVLARVSGIQRQCRRNEYQEILSLEVRTKTCPLFAVHMSGIIASHVGTENASVVSSSSKRHRLCQRSRVFPNRGNRTSHLCSWRG